MLTLQKRDIEEFERDSGTSAGKAGHVPPKSGRLTPMLTRNYNYRSTETTYFLYWSKMADSHFKECHRMLLCCIHLHTLTLLGCSTVRGPINGKVWSQFSGALRRNLT